MLEYITTSVQQVSSQPVGLMFAFILGVVSATTGACCMLPAVGILVGYSGAQANVNPKAALKSALFFTLGALLSLMLIGAIAGFVGQIVQVALGKYWKVFAGLAAVIFGLATLSLLPINLSFGKLRGIPNKVGKFGVVLAGLVLGGAVAACSLPCNPGIFVVIGAAILQGNVFWAIFMLALFAVGFSAPLGGVLLGVSLSKFSLAAKGADAAIRWVSGSILLITGFYFLITF